MRSSRRSNCRVELSRGLTRLPATMTLAKGGTMSGCRTPNYRTRNTLVRLVPTNLPANWRRISAIKSEQARWQFYDLSAPEDPAFGSIAAMIAAWTFWSCAVTAAVSDNRRCRVS